MCLQEFMYRLKQGLDSGRASVVQRPAHTAFTRRDAGSSPAGGTAEDRARGVMVAQRPLKPTGEGSTPSGPTDC